MAVFTDEGKTYHVRVGKGDIGRYVPVSYTHLDVYKRQPFSVRRRVSS